MEPFGAFGSPHPGYLPPVQVLTPGRDSLVPSGLVGYSWRRDGYWTASWKRGYYPGFADGFVEGLKPHG